MLLIAPLTLPADYGSPAPVTPDRHPDSDAVSSIIGQSSPLTKENGMPATLAPTAADRPRMTLAVINALAPKPLLPADARHPNTGKKKAARLANSDRPAPKRGALRSSVTVLRVDPDTLRRSRAGGRNVSDKVLDAAPVIARGVKSRHALRKIAAAR
jgi:hypothetical protein